MYIIHNDGGSNDNIVGIALNSGNSGDKITVQIGGIMKATIKEVSGINIGAGVICNVDSSGEISTKHATGVAESDDRFIIVWGGTDGGFDSLVMWIKGESY